MKMKNLLIRSSKNKNKLQTQYVGGDYILQRKDNI